MKMRLLPSILVLVAALTSAFTLEASLKKNMKQIGRAVKAVGQQLDDSAKNADSIAKLSDAVELLKKAQEQMPESLEKLEKAKQDESFKKFKETIQKEIDLIVSLKKTLETNDNTKAQNIFKEITDVKKKAHKEFDPEN